MTEANSERITVEQMARAIFEAGNEMFENCDPVGWDDKIGDPKEDAAREMFRDLARRILARTERSSDGESDRQ